MWQLGSMTTDTGAQSKARSNQVGLAIQVDDHAQDFRVPGGVDTFRDC